ncbi:hypothetical protein [Robertmurraya massiliosenegalensis]|uniref:hypothetical protein n=1 Tax=Robertmurraya massiliosenegalensis TaxID=1287657 RepID=UPI000304648E|nr:hypothetical protein [Robertmurraya massiliosenegalensis]
MSNQNITVNNIQGKLIGSLGIGVLSVLGLMIFEGTTALSIVGILFALLLLKEVSQLTSLQKTLLALAFLLNGIGLITFFIFNSTN